MSPVTDACPVLGEGFFFGLATAPAHVEDDLEDTWVDFARGSKGKTKGSRVSQTALFEFPFARVHICMSPRTGFEDYSHASDSQV